MERIQGYLNQFHPIVWVLLLGTVLSRGAVFMTIPFLSIYLSKTMAMHPILIGITVGISHFVATFAGFIGGHLSDRYGRKPIMLISLFGLAFVFFGFSVAVFPLAFILLNALNGLCNSFFEPTSQALIADLTDKEKRMKVYSLRYTAINVGASVGPLLGAYLAYVSANATFIITGVVYLGYAICLLYLMNRLKIATTTQVKSTVTFMNSLKIMKNDKALSYLIIGGILVNIGYSQLQSNVPLHLENTVENGVYVFSVLLSINAIMVVLLQMPISHLTEKYRPMQVMVVGALMLSIGLILFGFVNEWILAIVAVVFITVGEILIFPSNSVLIDQLAQENMRGIYFGAGQFRKIGGFLGPMLGGVLLSGIGGNWMFLLISIISLSSILLFVIGNRVQNSVLSTKAV